MRSYFNRALGLVVDRPWLSLLILLALSALAASGYVNPDWIANLLSRAEARAPAERLRKLPEGSGEQDVDRVNLAGSDAILVVDSEQFFTPEGAAGMRRVVEEIEKLDYVDSVLWMDRVPGLNIFGLPQPLLPHSTASESQFDDARRRALAHPLVAGQLLSEDTRTLLLLVKFDWLFVTDDNDCTVALREVAERAAAEVPGFEAAFQVTGRVPMFVTAMQAHELNQWRYQLIGYGMIVVMAIILFRGFTAVTIVALAPALGVFWTLGLLRFFALQDNPFNDVVLPVLLSLVGLTDGVHLMVQIRRLRASGLTPRDAARRGVREVGLACALTSLTTAIGFGSLSLAHHQIVREFGYCCVLGVAMTFLAVVITIPLAATWFGRRLHVGHDKSLIDQHLNRIGGLVDMVLARPRTFSAIAILSTLVLLGISLTLQPDERNSNSLPTHSEAALALRHMDEAMGGLEFAYVDIRWSENVPSDSAEVFEVVGEVDELLRREELVANPLSIRNFLDALPGEGPPADRMSLLDLLPPPLKLAYYSPEQREAKVSCRVQDLGIARYGPVFQRIETGLEEVAARHPDFSFDMSGSAVWRWRNLYQIVVDLAASLGSAAVIIFVVLAVVYRSVRIGLISVVPNVFPLAFTGAYLVLSGQALELVSVCAFTVCLGIAVDDTIHFLTRFEEERDRIDDQREAIRRAFVSVGTALMMTTIVLVSGFVTVMFSDSRDHYIFATMGTLTITSALFADLIFLPALLMQFVKPRRRQASAEMVAPVARSLRDRELHL